MFVTQNPVKDYAWGSTTELAELQGRDASRKPEAELWIGAHESDPSLLPDGRRLDDAVTADSERLLGAGVRSTFGDRLPFLMKVLAVDEPLSLQVHPSSERARLGHRRESEAGIAVDDETRTYRDAWHKPELLFALTRFEALAGFRDPVRTAGLLRLLRLPWADAVAERLERGVGYQVLRELTTELLHLRGRPLTRVLRDVGDAARHAGARAAREELRHRQHRKGGDLNAEAARAFPTVAALASSYPEDPGVLVALLLNSLRLAPGQAIFLNAGVVHAYVHGTGVEVMAASDNVLRAGLTPKHRDVEELLRVTTFSAIPPPRLVPAEQTATLTRLEPPVAEFALTVAELPVAAVAGSGPRAVLVLDGEAELSTSSDRLTATRGQSVFVADADGELRLTGTGRVAITHVPL